MSSSPAPAHAAEIQAHLKAWAEGFAVVLSQISGNPITAEAVREAPADARAADSDLWFDANFSGGLSGELSLRITSTSAGQLATLLTGEPAPGGAEGAELSASQKEPALELLRQVAGQIATRLPESRVELRIDAGQPPQAAAAVRQWLKIDFTPALWVEMVMPETFVTALTAAQIAPAPPRPSAERSGTQLETLMEVELAVTLRFGGRRMLLRDILDLCAGAVVELDRQIQEPVDLLLDGKLVARGDVVVVDGNYGLRVTQILATPTVL